MTLHDPMFLLPQASSIAPHVDFLFWFMVGMCTLVALGVFVAMIFFCVRYRHGSNADRSNRHQKSLHVELSWTLIPLGIFLGMFTWSLVLFSKQHTPPPDAQTVYVVAKQWMWKIQHAGGQREINMLHVPLGRPVRLTMTSQDVIHSFYVPAFRVKQDILPDQYTRLWFTPTKLGSFTLECAEYCGLDHSKMVGRVVVMRPAGYARWLERHRGPDSIVAQGRSLFRRYGCSGCHGDHATVHAPDLDGIYGRQVHLDDGSTVRADERYLRDSILLPDSQVVAGYAPIMPSFQDQIPESDLLKLIAYLKSGSRADGGHTEATPTEIRDGNE